MTKKNRTGTPPRRKQKVKKQTGNARAGKKFEMNDPNRPACVADLQQLYFQLREEIEARCRTSEMKSQIGVVKLSREYDVMKANQVVTQTMLGDNGIIDKELFRENFRNYILDNVGVVEDGKMRGEIIIDIFNVGTTPVPTSTISEHTGNGPTIIIG